MKSLKSTSARHLLFSSVLFLSACHPTRDAGTITNNPPATLTDSFGGERGNGAEYIKAEDSAAWFVNKNRSIRYCYHHAPGFGASQTQIEKAMSFAFETWFKYMKEKNAGDYSVWTKIPDFALATKSSFLAKCDGSEDLKFMFGVMDPEVLHHISGLHRPVAAAVQTQTDPNHRWGKGFVWLASQGGLDSLSPQESTVTSMLPDWTLPYNLEGILLHELGHVFGTEHVNGTIMRLDIVNAAHILAGVNQRKQMLTNIDGSQELVGSSGSDCKTRWRGTLGIKGHSLIQPITYWDTQTGNFRQLMDRDPVGQIQVELEIKRWDYTLIVSDSTGTQRFPITIKRILIESTNNFTLSIFKALRPNNTGGYTSTGDYYYSASQIASLTTKSGKKMELILGYNSYLSVRTPVSIHPTGDPTFATFYATRSILIMGDEDAEVLFITHGYPPYIEVDLPTMLEQH